MGILGYLLWGLLALLVVLLLAPVVLCAEVRSGTARVWLRVLFLRFPLYPARPRPPKKKKKTKKPPAEQATPSEEAPAPKKRSAGEWLELIRQTAEAAGAGLRFLCKWMLVYDVEAVIPVDAEDPARLAQRYGATQAAVGAARAALENLFHMRYKRLEAVPNFAGDDKIPLILACKVAVPPVIMIGAGGIALVQFLKRSRLFRRMKALRRAKRRVKKRRAQQKQNGQAAK